MPQLKSTGEQVQLVSGQIKNEAGHKRYLCILPPQAHGHNHRFEWVRAARLRFEEDNR